MSALDKPGEQEHQLSSPDQFLGEIAGVGESAAQQARTFLGQHADLISADVIAQIADREREKVVGDFKRRRQEGRANENYCNKPGIKVYFTDEGKRGVVPMCQKEGYPISESSWQEVGGGVWLVELPNAIYSMGMGGVQFYRDHKTDGEKIKGENPFATSYDMVIRIEGNSGALWQNVHYNWDLSPKS